MVELSRRDKENYYLDIAETVAERSTCLRRKFGAIIVNHDELISSGYNGAPRNRRNCIDIGYCIRTDLKIPRGERYEMCRSVHAEANAIISAARNDMIGGTMYLVGIEVDTGGYVPDASSCAMCKRLIINAGLMRVVVRMNHSEFKSVYVSEWVDNDDSLSGIPGY